MKHRKSIKKQEKILNSYPCDVYLHNALRFIRDNEPNVAYEEVCHAIIKSGGTLSDVEKQFWSEVE